MSTIGSMLNNAAGSSINNKTRAECNGSYIRGNIVNKEILDIIKNLVLRDGGLTDVEAFIIADACHFSDGAQRDPARMALKIDDAVNEAFYTFINSGGLQLSAERMNILLATLGLDGLFKVERAIANHKQVTVRSQLSSNMISRMWVVVVVE